MSKTLKGQNGFHFIFDEIWLLIGIPYIHTFYQAYKLDFDVEDPQRSEMFSSVADWQTTKNFPFYFLPKLLADWHAR